MRILSWKGWAVAAVLALILSCLLARTLLSRIADTTQHRKQIVYELWRWADAISVNIAHTETEPQSSSRELLEWLFASESPFSDLANDSPYARVCPRSGRILDHLGNPVVLISRAGRLVALGSSGPDGKWEGGKGDDVIAEVRRPGG